MKSTLRPCAALAATALGIATALAQQPAPPAPAFAAPDLTPAGVRALAANCAGCHGTDGKAIVDTDDLGLAGISRDKFVTRMTQYKEGKRQATLMHQLSKGFSEAEIAALADHFSRLPK